MPQKSLFDTSSITPEGWQNTFMGGKLGLPQNQVTQFAQQNPLSALGLAGMGGLALNKLVGGGLDQEVQGVPQLKSLEAQTSAEAQKAMNYLNVGGTSPAQRSAIDTQTQGRAAEIRNQYASMGLGNSTMMTSALQQNQKFAEAQKMEMTLAMYKHGIELSGLDDNLLKTMYEADQASAQATMDLVSGFAAALVGVGSMLGV